MISVGPDLHGTTDWTLLSGRVVMPADAATLQVHLTMDATGTVWHDGLLVAECLPGIVARLEGRPLQDTDPVRVWPVEAVVKVFPDEPAPRAARPARIACARNEKEPLQLAIRSPRDLQDVRIEVDPITGPGGARLSEVEVNVVGYVPIDHPTATAVQTPVASQDSVAAGRTTVGRTVAIRSARSALDLKANETQAVWVTVRSAGGSGRLREKVRLVHQGTTVAETPLTVHVWNFTCPMKTTSRRSASAERLGSSRPELYPEIVRFSQPPAHPDRIASPVRLQAGR